MTTAFRVSTSLAWAGSLKRPFFASSVAIIVIFARIVLDLSTEDSITHLTFVPAADDAWCRVGGDPLLSHRPREALAPVPQHGFVDMQAPSVLVLGFDDQVDVRVGLVRVQHHRVAVPDPEGEQPLLLNPTEQDPWIDLDFDPATGNVVASFDTATAQWSERGTITAKVLHLDRREAMAAGYIKTFRRLVQIVERALAQQELDCALLIADLADAEDHGLLGWSFRGSGQTVVPFDTLREQYPEVWELCSKELTT